MLDPWFRLFRLPNLLTVPGDPIAGFLLASVGRPGGPALVPMLAAAAASLCLYMFGLAVNDIVDIETDRAERPDRPLPSGQITVPQAKMAALAAALSGLNIALIAGRPALFVAGALAALILAYNMALKRIPVAGICAMGGCRGLSVALGVAAARSEWFAQPPDATCVPAALAALAVTAYVVAFSAIAKNEMAAEKPMGPVRWTPFAVLLIALPSVLLTSKWTEWVMPTVSVFLMAMTLMRSWLLGGILYRAHPVPHIIGGHICNLLCVQACLCAAAGIAGLLPALLLMALAFVFPHLAKRFYSS